jgi:hypothetical protein
MVVGGKIPFVAEEGTTRTRKNHLLVEGKKGILWRSGENPMAVGGKILWRSGEILRLNGGDEHPKKCVLTCHLWASNAHHEALC